MQPTRKLLIACLLLAVAACQPAPEERFGRAQAYFDEHEYRAAIIELKNLLQHQPEYPRARFLLARASYQLADFATAAAEAERALSQGLIESDVWFELGRALLAQGDATAVLERVVPNLPAETAPPEHLVMLGDTFLALGNRGEAAEHYLRALNHDASNAGALIGQAVIARQNGDLERAEELMEKAVEMNPTSDRAWRARGNFLRTLRRPGDAAEAYDRAISHETAATPLADALMARVNRVSALLDAGDVEHAAQRLGQLQSAYPKHPIIRLLTGRVAYAQEDYEVAEGELREYLADVPNDLRGFALLGAVNFSQNHLQQAEMYLQRAVRANVGGGAAARLLAETQLRLNKPGEAMSSLSTFGEEAEQDPVLMALYGRIHLGLGETASALEYFERGAAAAELDPAVRLSLAAGFFSAGDYDRAVELLETMPATGDSRYRREVLMMAAHIRDGSKEKAIAVGEDLIARNPDDATAHATVGVMRQTLGDVAGARKAFENALRIDAGNRVAGFALSRLEIGLGNLDAAERLLRNTLANDPAYLPALTVLADLLARQQRLDEFEPLVSAAIAIDTDNVVPRLLQIRVDLLRGDPNGAIAKIVEARKRFPDDPGLLHAEGLARVQLGQSEIALARLREAANLDRNDPRFQLDLAALSIESGDTRLALEAIQRYRELKPNNYAGLAIHVAALSRNGRFDLAREEIERFRVRHPDQLGLSVLAGDVEMAAGDAEAAAQAYEIASRQNWTRALAIRLARAYQLSQPDNATLPLVRWLEENPDDMEVRRVYGQVLETKGHTSEAIAEYERLLRSGGEDPVVLNNLAWHYATLGREEAVELARRAHELAPDNGSITDTYGWILFQRGDVEAALPLLEKAAEQSPNNPEIKFHLAAAYARKGNEAKASEVISAALESDEPFPSRADAEELAKSL